LVAVTTQVPALVLASADPAIAQPVAVPLAAVYVTAPVPEPPLVVNASGVLNVPPVDVRVNTACAPGARFTVVGADDDGANVASPAFVAVTTHVPALVLDKVEPVVWQPVAVPFAAVNVTAPAPDPPLVVSVSGIAKTPAVDVTVRGACAWGASVTTVGSEDRARKLRSPALVPVTVQVPTLVLDSVDPVISQPVAEPLTAVKVTEPVPEPPEVVIASGVPNVPLVDVTARVACAALSMVTVVGVDDATR
jgi:hypothetical protein